MGSSGRLPLPLPPLLLLLLLASAAQLSSGQLDLRQLSSLLISQWRAGQLSSRALGPAQLLASSELIVIPKLEITSPTVPKDGGSFFLYADVPISLAGLGGLGDGSLFADRNDTVQEASPSSPPSPPPSPPPSASSPAPPPSADAPPSPPAPPADDAVPLRNPTIIMSYDRRAGRQGRQGRDGGDPPPLQVSSGFHDVALQMLSRFGMDGRVCLLRAVCELSARPLTSNGLLGDLVNAAAEIPSTNSRALEEELKVARQLGLEGAPCTAAFDNCDNIIINQLAK